MNEKIEIKVKYSVDEYVRGMVFSQRKNSRKYSFFITLIIGLIGGGGGVYYLIYRDEISWNTDLLLKFFWVLIIVLPITYIMKDISFISEEVFKKQYASTALLQETYQICFDSDGINSESESFSNKVRWHVFTEVVQTDKDFHFFFSRDASLFIPKRVFTEEQQTKIKNLTRLKLGEKGNSI